MPRVNRREIFADDEIQVFHLINRCVRRTFLCGIDENTGRDFSHRKDWIRDRLEVLAGIFAIDVMGFAVLSNHMHVVARTRPDLVKTWSDDEVAVRWWNLFPLRRQQDGSPAEPTEFELNHIRNDASGLKEKRKRLSNVSWFMKCLSEPIAKRGNREEDVTGHFWETRFRVQPLLDEMAIAACMAYVDLNPVRASIAEAPETSDFTSAQARIKDRHKAQISCTAEAQAVKTEDGEHAGWLAPVELQPQPKKNACDQQTPRRASDKGCLFTSLDQYLHLLDWTGRQLRRDKPGAIATDLEPILERLDCTADSWLDLVRNFRRRFRTEAGRPAVLATVSTLRRTCRTGKLSS